MADVLSLPSAEATEARYMIVQYMEDVFRREVRNVGVFVQKGTDIVARFFGEDESGTMDGRKIKGLRAPDAYRQWVNYWRRTVVADPNPFSTIASTSRGNFLVLDGGTVTDTEGDSAADVAAHLYTVLVSEGSWAAALAPSSDDGASVPRLPDELISAFQQLNILANSQQDQPLVNHPIRLREPVKGNTAVPHRPQFSQQNGRLYVMEPLDFTDRVRDRAKDHAGFTAFMFADLKGTYGSDVETIAIVRGSNEDDESARYGLAMVKETNARVIEWSDPQARSTFVAERRQIALMPG